MIGVINNDRVGVRHVQTVFNNTGAQQQVIVPFIKIEHDILENLVRHFPMGHADFRLRRQGFQLAVHPFNTLDPVVDEIHLPAPSDFLPDRLGNHRRTILHDIRLHRQAVFRCAFDGAHIPQSSQRHMQSPRNWGRRQGQDVQADRPFLQPLFLGHAKALFFIHNQQSQIFKCHIRLQQPMGADENVHRSLCGLQQCRALLGRRPKTADHVHSQSKGCKSAGEGLIVLLGQNRGRHENRHLFAAHHGFEGSPQSDFRLTEADIAAKQAIHGLRLLHVRLDFSHCGQLIRRFLERKSIFEFHLPRCIRQKCKP